MDLTTESDVIERLEGTTCQWCDGGTLERGTYKDNAAAICDSCGTPAVQLW